MLHILGEKFAYKLLRGFNYTLHDKHEKSTENGWSTFKNLPKPSRYIKFLFLASFNEENLDTEEYLYALSIENRPTETPSDKKKKPKESLLKRGQFSEGLKLKHLAWRKLLNPFKWAEFVISIALTLTYFLFTVPLYIHYGLVELLCKPFRLGIFGKWPSTIIKTILWHIPAAIIHSVFYIAMNIVTFALNCLLSPVNTILKPLINFFMSRRSFNVKALTLFLMIAFPVFFSAIILLATGGAAFLPAFVTSTLPVLQSTIPAVMTFYATIHTFISSFIGALAAQIVLCADITLGCIVIGERIISGRIFSELFKRIADAIFFTASNSKKVKDMRLLASDVENNIIDVHKAKDTDVLEQKQRNALSGLLNHSSKQSQVIVFENKPSNGDKYQKSVDYEIRYSSYTPFKHAVRVAGKTLGYDHNQPEEDDFSVFSHK